MRLIIQMIKKIMENKHVVALASNTHPPNTAVHLSFHGHTLKWNSTNLVTFVDGHSWLQVLTSSFQCCAQLKRAHRPRGVFIKLEKERLTETAAVDYWGQRIITALSHRRDQQLCQILTSYCCIECTELQINVGTSHTHHRFALPFNNYNKSPTLITT